MSAGTQRRFASVEDLRCHWCAAPLTLEQVTADHILPRAFGGTAAAGNIVPACHKCQQRKGDLDPDLWYQVRTGQISRREANLRNHSPDRCRARERERQRRAQERARQMARPEDPDDPMSAPTVPPPAATLRQRRRAAGPHWASVEARVDEATLLVLRRLRDGG